MFTEHNYSNSCLRVRRSKTLYSDVAERNKRMKKVIYGSLFGYFICDQAKKNPEIFFVKVERRK